MKINVDLTENSDFLTPRRNIIKSTAICSCDTSILGTKLHKNIVDINYCIETDIEKSQKGGIIQGNGYRRNYMKVYKENDFYCERCGKVKKYPWEDFSKLLCPKCDKELQKDFYKFPWKEK